MTQKTEKILQIKVQLKDFRPSIYRTFLVSESSTFFDLHEYIQDAFGFYNYHLWHFYKWDAQMNNILEIMEKNEEFEDFWDFWRTPEYAFEPYILISEVFIKLKLERISYEYDFGDSWDFTVELQKTLESEESKETFPRLLKSKGWLIIEDCWGIGWYKRLIEKYKKKKFDRDMYDSWEDFEEDVKPVFAEYTPEDFFCDRQI